MKLKNYSKDYFAKSMFVLKPLKEKIKATDESDRPNCVQAIWPDAGRDCDCGGEAMKPTILSPSSKE